MLADTLRYSLTHTPQDHTTRFHDGWVEPQRHVPETLTHAASSTVLPYPHAFFVTGSDADGIFVSGSEGDGPFQGELTDLHMNEALTLESMTHREQIYAQTREKGMDVCNEGTEDWVIV